MADVTLLHNTRCSTSRAALAAAEGQEVEVVEYLKNPLTRAELVDPGVLLLDEATANLDLATEHRVVGAMQRVAHGRSTLLIAHRLQTARTADRIVVLGGGGVLELGSHDELLAADGHYASMWRAFELASQRA